jgi:hypothetical protein
MNRTAVSGGSEHLFILVAFACLKMWTFLFHFEKNGKREPVKCVCDRLMIIFKKL